ncbi:CAP domain-containing protein [Chloroflexota bacterium]
MTTIMKIITLSMLTIIVIFSMASCSPSVSSEDYESVKSALYNVESQLTEVQEKLAEAELIEAQYQSLNVSFEELQKQYDARNDEIQKLKTEYDELNTKYEQLKGQNDALDREFEELKRQYDVIIQGNILLNEEEIDQAIFTLINQERMNNGVDELEWGTYLNERCKQNSRKMAETGRLQYDEEPFVTQEVFWATRYGTIDQIAKAALTIWTNNDYRYNYSIINKGHIYGAVGTYKFGDVYYITYLASIYK